MLIAGAGAPSCRRIQLLFQQSGRLLFPVGHLGHLLQLEMFWLSYQLNGKETLHCHLFRDHL